MAFGIWFWGMGMDIAVGVWALLDGLDGVYDTRIDDSQGYNALRMARCGLSLLGGSVMLFHGILVLIQCSIKHTSHPSLLQIHRQSSNMKWISNRNPCLQPAGAPPPKPTDSTTTFSMRYRAPTCNPQPLTT